MTRYLKVLGEAPQLLDWAAIAAQGTAVRQQILAEELAQECLQKHGTLPLEEILMNRWVGGQTIIEVVDEMIRQGSGDRHLGTYTLRVMRMHDGSAVTPGAIWVQRCGMKSHYRDEYGVLRPMDTRTYARMKKVSRSRGDRFDPELWKEWKLDQDCCVTCGYRDAMELIQRFGSFSTNTKCSRCFEQVLPAGAIEAPQQQLPQHDKRAQAR